MPDHPALSGIIKFLRLGLWITTYLALSISPLLADDETRTTPSEAKIMALKAAQYVKDHDWENAKSAFHTKGGQFFDRDLYVFVQDFNCTFLAHGLKPHLVGRNIWNLKNPNGRFACQDIVNTTKEKGQGWTEYIFTDPATGEPAWKQTFHIAVGDLIVMVGAYRPE
ncbi:cache domain-containing protein [Kiloniella sp.]|uniref:cache domain-containing protein n=1 Tax=Kiloniella sp. TaxID=1938587 RepID=UPI003B01C05E